MREIVLYSPERLCDVQARVKRSAAELAAAGLIGALLCATGLLLRLQWLCIGGLAAGAFWAYYALDTGLFPLLAEKEFVGRMTRVQPGAMDVVWNGVDGEAVYVEGVRAVQVNCLLGQQRRVFYIRAEDALPQLPRGTQVRIEAVNRFIVKIAPTDA